MRVLFMPLGYPTHYFPMVSLAWAFRASGHEVRVAGEPALAPVIERSGLTAVPVGRDYDFMRSSNDLYWKTRARIEESLGRELKQEEIPQLPPELRRLFGEMKFRPHAELTNIMIDDLVALAREWRPDLIVGDPFLYAATLLAGITGVPLVRNLWGTDILRQIAVYPGLGLTGIGDSRDQWPELLLEIYDRYNVKVRADFAVRTIDPCPPSLQVADVPNRIGIQYVPYNGPGSVPRWLLEPATRPRVCVSWGTGTTHLMGGAGFLVPGVLNALEELDAEVILTVKRGDRDRVGEVPPGTRVVEELPLHLVLPTCGAIVNQGGAGTVLTAAFYGLPQVIIPQIMDQPFNADRMAEIGAGISLAADADSGAIKKAVSTVLFETRARDAARAVQEEMLGLPAPADVITILEKLV
jgi:UDP:flavonoid glycosyltransferase YjiC (YdhE family)